MLRTYHCPVHLEFEHWRHDNVVIETCPKCKNKVTQKLALNFKLKGPGFYSTDKEVKE